MKRVFWQLTLKNLLIFRRQFSSKFFDTCFLFFTNVIIFSYFMPNMGISANYGPFILIGAIASFGLFDTIGRVSELIADIEGDRTINFTLALPISSKLAISQIGISWALSSFLLTLLLIPIGKILVPKEFSLTQISFERLIPIYIVTNLFYGFFSLWLASLIKTLGNISHLFMRFINPIFMFGAYFYTWKSAFELSPVIGYVSLINPMVYIMEGMRSAALGPEGFLPFWICLLAVSGFTLLFALDGIFRLKRRLDCI